MSNVDNVPYVLVVVGAVLLLLGYSSKVKAFGVEAELLSPDRAAGARVTGWTALALGVAVLLFTFVVAPGSLDVRDLVAQFRRGGAAEEEVTDDLSAHRPAAEAGTDAARQDPVDRAGSGPRSSVSRVTIGAGAWELGPEPVIIPELQRGLLENAAEACPRLARDFGKHRVDASEVIYWEPVPDGSHVRRTEEFLGRLREAGYRTGQGTYGSHLWRDRAGSFVGVMAPVGQDSSGPWMWLGCRIG